MALSDERRASVAAGGAESKERRGDDGPARLESR
jgi:hypothetical protein